MVVYSISVLVSGILVVFQVSVWFRGVLRNSHRGVKVVSGVLQWDFMRFQGAPEDFRGLRESHGHIRKSQRAQYDSKGLLEGSELFNRFQERIG